MSLGKMSTMAIQVRQEGKDYPFFAENPHDRGGFGGYRARGDGRVRVRATKPAKGLSRR